MDSFPWLWHLPLPTSNIRLFEDEKLLISEIDSSPKTLTNLVYLQIDVELKKHLFDCLYLSANISNNNSYICSLGFSQTLFLYSPIVNNCWRCITFILSIILFTVSLLNFRRNVIAEGKRCLCFWEKLKGSNLS